MIVHNIHSVAKGYNPESMLQCMVSYSSVAKSNFTTFNTIAQNKNCGQ